jgi:uncharacterized protein (TIGR03437 family)
LAINTVVADLTPLPTTLAGSTVRVRDSANVERLAPLFFVSPFQINFLIPPGTAPGEALVSVLNSAGVLSLNSIQVAARVAPGLFAANANGQGIAAALALRIKANGALTYEDIARFDATQNKYVPPQLIWEKRPTNSS